MSLRKTTFAINEFYHIYNRGVEKRIIFKDKKDYEHFIYLMYVCNTSKSIVLRNIGLNFDPGERIVSIGAFVLMTNHFHILVKEKIEGGISKYMRKLLTAYSMYFNKKYKRTGKLFENVFKSLHCSNDRYLKYLYAYIHMNPLKIIDKKWRETKEKDVMKYLNYICAYQYSSVREYLSQKYKILSPSEFPKYFINPNDHKSEFFEWLTSTT